MQRLLLLHCGGTLGMVKGLHGYITKKGNLIKLILSNPNIAKIGSSLTVANSCNNYKSKPYELESFIASPLISKHSVVVDFFEFLSIVDSSSSSVEEWEKLTAVIKYFYDKYNGFVVIHGTDTLSYAASFLCFSIEGLTVSIVFTGSQLPLAVERNDAERNLVGAIKSCLLVIYSPDVYIFFNGWLHHGVRTTKISSNAFDAFYSTNPIRIEDLAKKIPLKKMLIEYRPFFFTKMCRDVGIFKIFPTIHPSHLSVTLYAYKGVILETYGSGAFPTNRQDLLDIIKVYIKNGGIIVNVSQCADGNTGDFYKGNYILSQVGVISGRNMTTESAFAKLSMLLANKPNKIRDCFRISYRGEIDEQADTKFYNFNNYTKESFS